MSKRLLEGIVDYYEDEEILTADGFDEAVIGIDEGSGRIIYSVGKCIEILMVEHEMGLDDSIELIDLFTILVKINNDDEFLQAKQ